MKGNIKVPLTNEKNILGLNLNIPGQLGLLHEFDYNDELATLPLEMASHEDDSGRRSYFYHNRFFESDDAEFRFNIVRRCGVSSQPTSLRSAVGPPH